MTLVKSDGAKKREVWREQRMANGINLENEREKRVKLIRKGADVSRASHLTE